MRRILIVIAAIVTPALVVAGATWSADTTINRPGTIVAKGTSSTGSETAPTSATAGISLKGLRYINVFVEPISGNMTAGRLNAYVMNPVTGNWSPSFEPAYTVTVGAVSRQAFLSMPVHPSAGRLSLEPSTLGTTVYVYIEGTDR